MIRKFYTSSLRCSNFRALVIRRNFSVDQNVLKHEEFFKNFDSSPKNEDLNESSSCVIESVKDTSRPPKQRFNSYPLPENDMYSSKPVWQQLNEIENAWKIKFKYKSRIEAQKKISRAKRSTESLEELEADSSRLVEIDNFRSLQSESKSEIVSKTEELDSEKSAPFITNRDEGTHLINDIKLAGDGYYEKVDLGKVDDVNRGPSSISPETLLKLDDKSLLTEIFGEGDDSHIDATRPSAIIESTTKLDPETWLNMDPNHILIQQDLLKSKNSTQILSTIGEKLKQMNAVNVSTAIHRLAKYSNPYNRFAVCNHESFGKLVSMVGDHMLQFDPQGLTNIFWSITKLRITPKWINCLLEQINIHANSLNVNELANCLFCISKLTRADDLSLELRFKILSLVQDKITQFKRPLDLTCVSTALARLNVRNPVLFGHISSQVLSTLDDFKIQEICGVAWAYASLGFTDRLLFGKIKQFIESNADSSNIGNIVHLAWALSKIKQADADFFLYTISPLVRSHLSSLSCKHITTIAWAYVNAGIEDEDLFNDIANTLLHHVDEMSTHDVASSVVAFSHFEDHKILLKKIKARASLMLNEFTPLQLSKIVAGFSGIGDEHFYNQLAKVVDSKLHLMCPENIVEILSGFTSANVLPISLFSKLLNTVSRSFKKMYAEDSLMLLELLEKLGGTRINLQMSKLFSNLAQNLIEQIDQRVSRWRCFDISQITIMFRCLKLGDDSSNIMNTLVKQLVSCLNRVFKSAISPENKRGIFVDFVLSTNQLPLNCQNILKTQLAKDSQLVKSFNNFLTLIRIDINDSDSPKQTIKLLHSLTNLGFSDHVTASLLDQLVEHEDELGFGDDLDLFSKLVWSLVESNFHTSWAVERMSEVSKAYEFSATQADFDSLVRLMWSCVVLSEDQLLMNFTGNLTKFENLFPTEVLYAQQTALHILKCLNSDVIFNTQLQLPSGGSDNVDDDHNRVSDDNGGKHNDLGLDKQRVNILREWLDYQRDDLYKKSKKHKRVRVLEIDHDSLISESLIKMKIPHKTLHVVENIYRISIAFPVENQLLDVIGFTDVLVPLGQVRASTLLRQRQLQILGYGLHPLRVSSLYECLNSQKAKNLIAETISSFNHIAKDYVSFNKMDVKDEKVPSPSA
ncbi:hypothetical protein MACK_003099 [Theileria orientalis]|uniref:RNA-editing substrate-binding complex 6 protein domain-containing protein n=1 Tax=Theileria orientalis TaxID=68886 RepID=A0A976ME48_THEOR|nr:hypothetical protein MACK_003099 [Theileria orientalis]